MLPSFLPFEYKSGLAADIKVEVEYTAGFDLNKSIKYQDDDGNMHFDMG